MKKKLRLLSLLPRLGKDENATILVQFTVFLIALLGMVGPAAGEHPGNWCYRGHCDCRDRGGSQSFSIGFCQKPRRASKATDGATLFRICGRKGRSFAPARSATHAARAHRPIQPQSAVRSNGRTRPTAPGPTAPECADWSRRRISAPAQDALCCSGRHAPTRGMIYPPCKRQSRR